MLPALPEVIIDEEKTKNCKLQKWHISKCQNQLGHLW